MLDDLLMPLPAEKVKFYKSLSLNQWGNKTAFYQTEALNLEDYDLAIVGVKEERGTVTNKGCMNAPDQVRENLYTLINHTKKIKLIDLGNIEAGATISDTYFAVSKVVSELVINNVIPIVIGGSHDLTYPMYLAYQYLSQNIKMIVVDEALDLSDMNESVSDLNHMMKILTYEPSALSSFGALGYQSYYTDTQAIETMEKLNYDCYRLGELRSNMEEVEPAVRDANLISFDISAIRQSDAPGKNDASPNGFFGEEACQICRYAGISEQLSSIGFFNFNPKCDNNNQTSQLLAQMIWYFADGFYSRKNESGTLTEKDYFKYIVDFKEGENELTFWKSKKSDRWWMQINNLEDDENKRPYLAPCSYADYQLACNSELPDKWIKAYRKWASDQQKTNLAP